jgi:hypothetical protein
MLCVTRLKGRSWLQMKKHAGKARELSECILVTMKSF